MPRPKPGGRRNRKIQGDHLGLGTGRHDQVYRFLLLKKPVVVKIDPPVQIRRGARKVSDPRKYMICAVCHMQGSQRNSQGIILYPALQIIPIRCGILMCFCLPGYQKSQSQPVNNSVARPVTGKQRIIIPASRCASDIRRITKIYL